jgi:phage virion morphogenesis protein
MLSQRQAEQIATQLKFTLAPISFGTFAGTAQRIATVHHFGLRDRLNKNGLMAQYPARELLGLDAGDVETITDLVLRHLA